MPANLSTPPPISKLMETSVTSAPCKIRDSPNHDQKIRDPLRRHCGKICDVLEPAHHYDVYDPHAHTHHRSTAYPNHHLQTLCHHWYNARALSLLLRHQHYQEREA